MIERKIYARDKRPMIDKLRDINNSYSEDNEFIR